ncbi:MAG: hypothetical protein KC636_31500, partial [Myxococcales bacterium]|nr:hypothetical protein [Myxococcales bacterium]
GTETGGSGLLPEGWQTQLTRAGGCADVTMYAYNEDQTIALYFSGGPVVEKAHTDGMLLQAITLPDDAITLKLQVGEKLAGAWCNDAVSPESQPQVAAEWTATAGTLTLTVTPTSEGSDPEYPSNATLELTHVDFSPGEGADAPVHVESFSMADVGVGWLPG